MRLIIVGAVHIAQALVPMAAQLGLGVVVVDPRRSFATDERFPNVTVMTDWPDEALDALKPDSRTAVITLTHDPKLDDPALDRALRSEAFYIGALGSRRTHARAADRLRALGHADEAMARIRGPVGLNIAAVTAPEIALSIVAEFVAVRRNATPSRSKAGGHRRRRDLRRVSARRGGWRRRSRTRTGCGDRIMSKGSVLDDAAVAALRAAGRTDVIAARLEPGDVAEDAAAARMAAAARGAGPGQRPRRQPGGSTCTPRRPGCCVVDAARDRPRSTRRSRSRHHRDAAGRERGRGPKDMVATIKIIPFAVPGAVLARVEARRAAAMPAFSLHPFRPLRVGLVLSELPGLKESVTEGTIAATRGAGGRRSAARCCRRCAARMQKRRSPPRCAQLLAAGAELLLVAGASATVDRRDVGPAGVVAAGRRDRAFRHAGRSRQPDLPRRGSARCRPWCCRAARGARS